MTFFPNRRSDRIILLLSVLLFALGFFHPWFQERVPDDAFYYFQVARNIARTGHSTFDGKTLATGYHPLWMGVAVVFYFVAGSALPYALLIFALILFLIYALGVLRLLEQLGIEGLDALLFKCLFIFNPAILTMGWSNGLETAPLMLCIFLLMRQCLLRLGNAGGNSTLAGIACAMAFLSRLDSILFTYPSYLWAFRRDLRHNPLPALIPVLTAGAFFSVHHFFFGSFVPSSADAMRFALYSEYIAAHHPVFHTGYYIDAPAHLLQFIRNSVEIVTTPAGLGGRIFGSTLIAKLIAAAVALVAAVELIRLRRASSTPSKPKTQSEYLIWGAVVVPVVLLFAACVTTARSLQFRPWYYPPLGLALGCAAVACWKSANLHVSRLLVTAFVVGMACSAVSDIWQRWEPQNPLSRQLVVQNILTTLPPNTRLGSFNSGVYGWSAPGRIVNLDGLVNEQAFIAIKHHELDRYMIEAGISYILDVDDPAALHMDLALRIMPETRFKLELIRSWPDENPKYSHHLYRVSFSRSAPQPTR